MCAGMKHSVDSLIDYVDKPDLSDRELILQALELRLEGLQRKRKTKVDHALQKKMDAYREKLMMRYKELVQQFSVDNQTQ